MIEIQSEAYYRALKRIEDEKNEADKEMAEKKKWKWYDKVLFLLNVIIFPWSFDSCHFTHIILLLLGGIFILAGKAFGCFISTYSIAVFV